MRTVQTLHDRQQKMATAELGHRDVFGMKLGPAGAVVQVFQVRSGRVVERVELGTETAIVGASEGGRARGRASSSSTSCAARRPKCTCRPSPTSARRSRAWLSERAGRRVRIVVPQRGEKRGLVDLANRNAALAYQTRFNQATAAQYDALETLQARARRCRRCRAGSSASTSRRSRAARRWRRWWSARTGGCGAASIGSSGSEVRGARSSRRGSPSRSPSNDDFAAMHEVVGRRYRKLLEEGGPFPDLILIDGGKGQLSAAYAALEELGLANLVAVGIAKKEELLYTRDHDDPIALAPNDPALLLLQRIRDEAHRFAVTFHRRARTMRDLRSELDDVPGIGPRRRRALLTQFGSLAGVRRATREELAAAVGAKVADAVLAFFAGRP